MFSLFLASSTDDTQEKANELAEKLNYETDLGKFFIMWFRKYCKHKNLKIDIKINEGGEVMLETVFEEVKMEGRMEGRVEGKHERDIEIIKKALAKGYDIEEVADLTGLSPEQIRKLSEEMR